MRALILVLFSLLLMTPSSALFADDDFVDFDDPPPTYRPKIWVADIGLYMRYRDISKRVVQIVDKNDSDVRDVRWSNDILRAVLRHLLSYPERFDDFVYDAGSYDNDRQNGFYFWN